VKKLFLNESQDLQYKPVDITYKQMLESFNIMNETYYGKHPDLEKCEEYLGEMRQALLSGQNPNKCAAKGSFERTIANLFGFESLSLCILAEERGNNAFTPTFFMQGNHSYDEHFYDLVKSGNTIRYKDPKNKTLSVFIYNYGLRNVPPAVEMGIIVHEIGHNFFLVKEQAQNAKLEAGRENIMYILRLLERYNFDPRLRKEIMQALLDNAIYLNNPQKYFKDYYAKLMSDKMQEKAQEQAQEQEKKNKGIRKALKIVGKLFTGILLIPYNLVSLLFFPLFLKCGREKNKKILRRKANRREDYNAEKFADNFAITYGYGKEVAIAFSDSSTFSRQEALDEKIPFYRITKYMNDMYFHFITIFTNEHPDSVKRVQMVITKLEWELKNNRENLSPKQIADIEQQIKDVKKIVRKQPLYKKFFNKITEGARKDKDEAGSGTRYKETDIYNFDKDLYGDKVKSEDTPIVNSYEMPENIFCESGEEMLYRFLDEEDESFMNEITQSIFDELTTI
jgi:hypothetical protein